MYGCLIISCTLGKIVRMLLKQGYRHVYISRAFAKRNGFIPDDATPGFYGYTGLISIGAFLFLLSTQYHHPSSSSSSTKSYLVFSFFSLLHPSIHHQTLPLSPPLPSPSPPTTPKTGEWPITLGKTTTRHAVYLSEESHFDVVLGRSFMERRSVKTDLVDMTSVICMDTGEKVDCEVVIIRDGKGEYVTVT